MIRDKNFQNKCNKDKNLKSLGVRDLEEIVIFFGPPDNGSPQAHSPKPFNPPELARCRVHPEAHLA